MVSYITISDSLFMRFLPSSLRDSPSEVSYITISDSLFMLPNFEYLRLIPFWKNPLLLWDSMIFIANSVILATLYVMISNPKLINIMLYPKELHRVS